MAINNDNITPAPSASFVSLAPPPSSTTIQTKPSFSLDLDLNTSKPRWLSLSAQVWEFIKMYFRFGLLCLSLAIIGCTLGYHFTHVVQSGMWSTTILLWPVALPAIIGVFYDLSELVVRFVRHGRGMPPKALIGCELIALLGCLAGVGLFLQQVLSFPLEWLDSSDIGTTVAVGAMTFLSAAIRLILWVRACIDRSRELKAAKPRVMYVPSTGEVVYLIPRARRNKNELEMFDEIKESLRKDTASEHEEEDLTPPLPPAPAARRPTGLMDPPPDDYEPDAAELERRRRGDAQPQLLLLPGEAAAKFSSNIYGSTPGGAFAVEGKVLGRPKWADSDSLRSSDMPRRRSWG
ncbi:hypothetical protein B0T11DRAFT_328766 [Plectosphaerella cucumerina]|uniref:Uncharacterized protein n=1 Tax=Plectosphaerella cucumerina TaxID=40658 RepID=A0A8K0X405_9PEZI|nr:hypothetical protein B0T11DRAFT_328766 [Plectosphaerella cucumerina]